MPESYFDRKPKIKTVEEMMAKLKERSSQAPQEVKKEPKPPLEWLRRNRGEARIFTTDGRYSIDATCINEIWHYDAWRRSPRAHLGRAASPTEAKVLCETDNNS